MRSLLILGIGLLLATSAFAQLSIDTQKCTNREGTEDEQMAACTRAISSGQLSSPNLAITFSNRGIVWGRKGDYDRAIADYNEAIRLNPQNAVAYNNRGNAWGKKGDYDHALADYNEAIRVDPQYATAYYNRGSASGEKGDYDRAIADYSEAIRLNPQDATAYNNRGIAWGRKGDYDRALADYNEAIRLNPQDASVYGGRGRNQFYLGRFESSAADFAQSLRLNGEQPYVVIWRYLALARGPGAQLAMSELSASAVPLDKQKWPAPVIELFGGRIDDTALRKAAEHADTKTQADQSCEVSFYLAQWRLLKSQPNEARVLLQEAEQKCQKTYVEYTGAVAELKRLGDR